MFVVYRVNFGRLSSIIRRLTIIKEIKQVRKRYHIDQNDVVMAVANKVHTKMLVDILLHVQHHAPSDIAIDPYISSSKPCLLKYL